MKTIKQIHIKASRIPIAKEDQEIYRGKITCSDALAAVARALLADRDTEAFIAIPVDSSNRVLGVEVVGEGGPNSCPVDPSRVFRAAILMGASGLFGAHNHPSGSIDPSADDVALTARLKEAGKLLNIPVLDHMIIGHGTHTSLAERGLL